MCTIVKNSILEDVLVKYKTGMCLKDIAADYGISDTKVKKLLMLWQRPSLRTKNSGW